MAAQPVSSPWPPLEITPVMPPLERWDDGSVRVGGTRLLLDIVITAYKQGDTVEEIAANYGAMPVEAIIGTLSFYFANRESVDAFIARNAEEAERFFEEWEREHPQPDFRKRFEAERQRRANANANSGSA